MILALDNYKIRKKKFPQGYPQPGTQMARILECLEAEPATCEEIAEYIDTTTKIASALAIILMNDYKLIARVSTGRYRLLDPELISLIYGSLQKNKPKRLEPLGTANS